MAGLTSAVGGSIKYGFDRNVQIVQGTLNRFLAPLGGPDPRLATDGICGAKTIAAIKRFQRHLGFLRPDGRVDVNKRTHKGLTAGPNAISNNSYTYMVPNVPLIAQDNKNACWYAAAQMLIQWKRNRTLSTLPKHPDPSQVPAAVSVHNKELRLSYSSDIHFAKVLGLVAIPAQTLELNTIRELLVRYGPLWTGGQDHVVVIVGVNERFDRVYVHDPSPINAGQKEWRSYTDWFIFGNTPSSIGKKPDYEVSFMYHP
jgi:hypothetical protein